MKGVYNLKVSTNKIKYELSFKRGVTIIKGDSATGKTELIRLIQMYQRNGESSGVKLECTVRCQAIWRSLEDAVSVIKSTSNEILFFDETDRFVLTHEFASAVKHCDCYIVIINRESIDNLAYSVKEIKQLVCKKKQVNVNMLEELYPRVDEIEPFIVETVVTEDMNSGFEMFSAVFNCTCISAGGSGNISKALNELKEERNILVIVDGAAFGAFYERIRMCIKQSKGRIVLWMPESFEYLLLKSGIIDGIDEVLLIHTELYADTKDYLSWERFYTDVLEKATKNMPEYRYTKSKLTVGYQEKANINKFSKVIPSRISVK